MNILLPSDLNPITDSVARALSWVSLSGPLNVTLVHCIDPTLYTMGDMNGNLVMHTDTLDREVAQAEQQLQDLAKEGEARFKGSHFHTELLMGAVEDRIADFANQGSFDLIISSSEGTHSFFRSLQGSITGNLSRQAKAPILALPVARPLPNPLNTVVIAHEFSGNDFSLTLKDRLPFFKHLDALVKRIVLVEIVTDLKQAEAARTAMSQFAELNDFKSPEFYTPLNDELEEGLESCMDEYTHALLCIGNHQFTGFRYFLEGCTAAELINKYDRPLLSFPLETTE